VDIGHGEGGGDTGGAVSTDQDSHLELGNSVRGTSVVDGVRSQQLVRSELSDSQTVALVLQSTIVCVEKKVSYACNFKSEFR
jgi:hypothetical protein